MDAQPADPRDGRWRQKTTAYRVDFWKPLGSLEPRRLRIGVMFESDEWLLTDVRDVAEAIAWADENADGRSYVLYAAHDRGAERGLIRLRGVDPTVSDTRRHKDEVEQLFAAHGYSGEVLMEPVVAVDERVFVLSPHGLSSLTDPEGLVASLERCLDAPVRLVPSTAE